MGNSNFYLLVLSRHDLDSSVGLRLDESNTYYGSAVRVVNSTDDEIKLGSHIFRTTVKQEILTLYKFNNIIEDGSYELIKTNQVGQGHYVVVSILNPTFSTKVKVTFDENYDDIPTYERELDKGTALGNEMPDDPTRSGYIFEGWFEEDSEVEFTAETVVDENITVYAKWEVVNQTITPPPIFIPPFVEDGIVELDEEIPQAAPEVEEEEEEVPEAAPEVEEEIEVEKPIEIEEEETPEATPTLPKTGYVDSMAVSGIGIALLGLGFALRKRNK